MVKVELELTKTEWEIVHQVLDMVNGHEIKEKFEYIGAEETLDDIMDAWESISEKWDRIHEKIMGKW